eukprot:9470809-Pyramimonas_sp.AAC.1
MSDANRALLAHLGIRQHETGLPVLAGGDYNMHPSHISKTDFGERGRFNLIAQRSQRCTQRTYSQSLTT